MHASKARSRILGTLTGKWQRDAPFFTQSGLHKDSISGQVRNTTVQVGTVGEGFGIGSEFRQTCCAANNFRDHEVLLRWFKVLQSLTFWICDACSFKVAVKASSPLAC